MRFQLMAQGQCVGAARGVALQGSQLPDAVCSVHQHRPATTANLQSDIGHLRYGVLVR